MLEDSTQEALVKKMAIAHKEKVDKKNKSRSTNRKKREKKKEKKADSQK